MQEARKTPLYENHVRHGGKMVAYGGWFLPVQYSGITAEHTAVRENAGLFDCSHMGEILITGEGALSFLNKLCTNNLEGMENGRCRYSPMCTATGGTVDDVIIYKEREDQFLCIVNAANTEKDYEWMRTHAAGLADVSVENVSDQYALLALQGPHFLDVVQQVGIEGTLPEKPYQFTREIRIGGFECLVSTTGYTGEAGIEIYMPPQNAGLLFDRLIEAGAVPCGLGARDTLRFESCMPLYGHELSAEITPLEAGLKMFVKLDKPSFIGKEALLSPPTRKRIGLALLERGIAREHCPVYDQEGKLVGETTSGGPAPTIGKNMAMALVQINAAEGERFYIEIRGKKVSAERAPMPFYRAPKK